MLLHTYSCSLQKRGVAERKAQTNLVVPSSLKDFQAMLISKPE